MSIGGAIQSAAPAILYSSAKGCAGSQMTRMGIPVHWRIAKIVSIPVKCTAEINDYDVGLAVTDQIEEMAADSGGRTRSREGAFRRPGDR
jgi:hypothetical protein